MMPTRQWLKTTGLTSWSCSVLFWVGWVLSHSPFSKPRVEGIATSGNFGGTRRDALFTALKVTHTTGVHISPAKACHMITPIVMDLEKCNHTRHPGEQMEIFSRQQQWYHHLPSGHKVFCLLSFTTCRMYSFSPQRSRPMSSIHCLQPERQGRWVMKGV